MDATGVLAFPDHMMSHESSNVNADSEDRPRDRPKILVVDDNEGLRDLMGMFLTDMGFQVTTCGDGREALREIVRSGRRYDAIISDYHMPDVDGLSLARHVRAWERSMPMFLVTGEDQGVLSDEDALEAGFVGCFRKPIRFVDLADRLLASLAIKGWP